MKIKTLRNKYGNFTVYGTDRWFNRQTLPLMNLTHEKPIVTYVENNGKKYDEFIDVGANYGYYSVMASHYIPKVFAIEAHPIRYGFLKWNVMHISNIRAINEFVGLQKPVASKDPSGMVANIKEKSVEITDTITFPLDFYIDKEVKSLVKIDVEGNEKEVLDSASESLKSGNVDWIVEIHKYRGVPEEKVFSYFKGYEKRIMMKGQKISHYLFWRK